MQLRRTLAALTLATCFPSVAAATTVVAQWNMDNTFGTTIGGQFRRNGNDGAMYNWSIPGPVTYSTAGTKVVVPNSPIQSRHG